MVQIKYSVKINNWQKEFSIRSLNLHQPFNGHHTFDITVVVDESIAITNIILKNLLGESATITIAEDKKEGCTFKGFVDQINTTWTKSSRILKIKGFSPSIFMDCSPQFRTFYDKSLNNILKRITEGYSSNKLPNLKQKSTSDKVPFAVQNQETDYRFLCRMADNSGKLFFYTGQELYFGDIKNAKANSLELTMNKDCQHLALSQNLAPLNFQLEGYNYVKNKEETQQSKKEYGEIGEVVKATIDKSGIYPKAKVRVNYLLEKPEDLNAPAQKITNRQAHELVTLSGTSNRPELTIGSHISIQTKNDDLIGEGKYIVMEVNHQVSSDGAYQNNFSAIPEGYPFPIRMQQGQNPMCGPLSAIVKDHKDEKGLGRVRVQFVGDSEASLSPWMRVLVPYTKGGGFYFLPEKEDKVLVFFEDFNPEKSPFVLGSYFHGQSDASKWKDGDNSKKGIQGNKIAFLWEEKTGKLTIEAEEIELKAKKEISIDGGKQLTQKANRIDLN